MNLDAMTGMLIGGALVGVLWWLDGMWSSMLQPKKLFSDKAHRDRAQIWRRK